MAFVPYYYFSYPICERAPLPCSGVVVKTPSSSGGMQDSRYIIAVSLQQRFYSVAWVNLNKGAIVYYNFWCVKLLLRRMKFKILPQNESLHNNIAM